MMNSGLVVIGLLVNGFAYGFYRIINNYKLAKTIWILFAISGVGFSLTGVFQVTPFWTADDIIHNVFALIAYFSSLAAIAICAKTVFCVPEWNIYRQFSFVVVILGLSLVVLFNIQTLDSIEGLVQRVLLALPLLWVELVSLRSLQLLHSDGIV